MKNLLILTSALVLTTACQVFAYENSLIAPKMVDAPGISQSVSVKPRVLGLRAKIAMGAAAAAGMGACLWAAGSKSNGGQSSVNGGAAGIDNLPGQQLAPQNQPMAKIQTFEQLSVVPHDAWKYCPMTLGVYKNDWFTCDYNPDYTWPQVLDPQDKLSAIAVVAIIGDMLGKANEFNGKPSDPPWFGSYTLITDMTIGGKFDWKNPGDWTDDTALMLCRLNVFLKGQRFLPRAIMQAIYDYGAIGLGKPYATAPTDYGGTTNRAKDRFNQEKDLVATTVDVQLAQSGYMGGDSGSNGCLMAFAPYATLAARLENWADAYYHILHGVGMINAHPSAIQSGVVMGWVIRQMVRKNLKSKEAVVEVLNAIHTDFLKTPGEKPTFQLKTGQVFLDDATRAVLDDQVQPILTRTLKDWQSISIDSADVQNFEGAAKSLRTAFWAFFNSDSTEEGLLKIINLGRDSDTVAAIAGQIFGAYYGFDGLPRPWLNLLVKNTQPPVGMDKPVVEMIKDFTTMDLKGFDAKQYLVTEPNCFPWHYDTKHPKFKEEFQKVLQLKVDLPKDKAK